MFDLPLRTFFFIAIVLSFVLFLYDRIMLKLGLYRKVLRKAKPFTPEKYNQFKILLKLLMPISPILCFATFIVSGLVTGKWLFFFYLYAAPAITAIPSWLILKHIGEQAFKLHKG